MYMKINANLFLYKEGRKTPFTNGYRPLFNIGGKRYSGSIQITNKDQVFPGEKSLVTINFFTDFNLDIQKGAVILFGELPDMELGEIEVLNVIDSSILCNENQ